MTRSAASARCLTTHQNRIRKHFCEHDFVSAVRGCVKTPSTSTAGGVVASSLPCPYSSSTRSASLSRPATFWMPLCVCVCVCQAWQCRAEGTCFPLALFALGACPRPLPCQGLDGRLCDHKVIPLEGSNLDVHTTDANAYLCLYTFTTAVTNAALAWSIIL